MEEPLDFLSLFEESFRILKSCWLKVLCATVIFYGPFFIFSSLLNAQALFSELNQPGLFLSFGFLMSGMILAILGFSAHVFQNLAIAFFVSQSVQGEALALKETLKKTLKYLWVAIGTSLLGWSMILGWSLLFLVPGLIYSVYYAFSLYAVALRAQSPKNALKYSRSLVQGRWWRVFGLMILLSAAFFILSAASGIIFKIFALFFPNPAFLGPLNFLVGRILDSFLKVAGVVAFLRLDRSKSLIV